MQSLTNIELITNIINDNSYVSLLDEETKRQIINAMVTYAKIKCKEQIRNCIEEINKREDRFFLNEEYCSIIRVSNLPNFDTIKEEETFIKINPVIRIKSFITNQGKYILLLLDPIITNWELKISNNNDHTILFYVKDQKKPLLFVINNCPSYTILGNPFDLSEYEIKKIVDYIEIENTLYFKDYFDGTYDITSAKNSLETLLNHLNIYKDNIYADTDMKYKNPQKFKIIEENSGNWLILKEKP